MSKWEWFACVVIGTAVIAAVIFVLYLASVSILLFTPMRPHITYETTYSLDLISLRSDTQISGSFWLGSGYINKEQMYFFYYKVGEDEYKLGYVPASKSTIRETDNPPKLHVREIHIKPIDIPKLDLLYNYRLDVSYGTIIHEMSYVKLGEYKCGL